MLSPRRHASCSISGTSSSSSSSTEWKDHPVIVARAECFETNTYQHVEEKNPYEVAIAMSSWVVAKDINKIKITVNGVQVPIYDQDASKVYDDVLRTIENESHFLTKGDFEL